MPFSDILIPVVIWSLSFYEFFAYINKRELMWMLLVNGSFKDG